MEENNNWTVVRVSTVISKAKLPRPKIVRNVVHRGTYEECMEAKEKITFSLKPVDQSTEDIKVEFTVVKNGRDITSSRQWSGTNRLVGDASEPNP